MRNPRYVDMHCHCTDYDLETVKRYLEGGYMLVSVSEDWESIMKNLEYLEELGDKGFTACMGIHPWVAHKHSAVDARRVVELAVERNVDCLGEIGLDKVFVPMTLDRQREIFTVFLEAAHEYDLAVNLHTPGTWSIVYDMLVKYDVQRAYFHWYTGPIRLLEYIRSTGYYIGANPAWRIQGKHRRILEAAPIEVIVTESDAPYEYKGVKFSPDMIPGTIESLARNRGISVDEVLDIVLNNAKKLLGLH